MLHNWIHSPQCVICFFPEWFANRQPDWPVHTHLVGFPLWDGGGAPSKTGSPAMSVPSEIEEFLDAGEPPVVFTPGSAAATMHRFFAESVEAARRLGVRAMLVTNFREQLPRDLPPRVKAFGYLPFSELLPRAALLVYHGGIGTMAQTIRAGVPQLWCERARSIRQRLADRAAGVGLKHTAGALSIRSRSACHTLDLADRRMLGQCRQYAAKTDSAAALTRACELVEALAVRRLERRIELSSACCARCLEAGGYRWLRKRRAMRLAPSYRSRWRTTALPRSAAPCFAFAN